MGNLGGGEVLVVLLLGLIILGPKRLPVVGRQVGRMIGQIRRVSTAFQEEFRASLNDPAIELEARERGSIYRSEREKPKTDNQEGNHSETSEV